METVHHASRRQFMKNAAVLVGASILPKSLRGSALKPPAVDTASQSAQTTSHEKVPWKVKPFPMTQVRLLDGPFLEAMETNRRYLFSLPNDRLLRMFRITAGLPSAAEPLGGWESPKSEVRGHFSGGHYLSSSAPMIAFVLHQPAEFHSL
ncbi:MAG TPA: beta-L-arabinofuranosidase domain-containing protein [Terriglobia bacterium]|nr:beta-L-arabinofuranosidase domain-containing protein [Terriglobia bacterium]